MLCRAYLPSVPGASPEHLWLWGLFLFSPPKSPSQSTPNNHPPLSKSASPPVLKRALELVEPIPEGDLITLLTTFVGLYCHGIQHDLHNNEAVPSLWFRPGIKLGIWTFTVMLLSWSPFNGVLKVNLVLQFVMVGFFFKAPHWSGFFFLRKFTQLHITGQEIWGRGRKKSCHCVWVPSQEKQIWTGWTERGATGEMQSSPPCVQMPPD